MSAEDHLAELLRREQNAMEAVVGSYVAFHRERFDYLLRTCREVCPAATTQVLDVGLSVLTMELLKVYDCVTTLGFPLEAHSITSLDLPGGTRKSIAAHIDYDLNAAQDLTPVDCDERFDLIVFAEVIEHLHTAPELVLRVLRGLMKPGGTMIVQTPNAAALHKRFNLLVGRNPYEKIRINPRNPGHFREYTKDELIAFAAQTDLQVIAHAYRDYFGWTEDSVSRVLFKTLVAIVPALARGQTLVLRRPLQDGDA